MRKINTSPLWTPRFRNVWEKHAHARLLGMGFEPAAEAWPSCYIHKDSDIFLVLYVDDFLMSGPENLLKNMWEEIAKCLDIDEPAPMSLYLGCLHDESTLNIDGRKIRTMTFNQESFFTDKIERYKELCKEKGGKDIKLHQVTTPYLKEQAKQNAARRPEWEGEREGVMCRYCRHAFTKEEAEVEPFTMNRIIHCPFCDLPLDANNLMIPTNLAGQLSKGANTLESTLPSLADNEKTRTHHVK